jgi:hypothetical protein
MRKPLLIATVGAMALAVFIVSSTPATGGCWGRSPASMAELTINWETLTKIPALEAATTEQDAPVVTTDGDTLPANEGEPAPEAPKPVSAKKASTSSSPFKLADKPYMIFVSDPAASAVAGFDTVTKVILDDDRVKLGSHAFHAVKMTPEDAKADPVLAEKGGKEAPRIIFVGNDLKNVKALEGGSLKLGEVWSAMKATSNRAFKQDLDALTKNLKEVLVEFDKINAERSTLAEKEKREADKATPADVKAIAAKRAELDAREKKAVDRKTALWDLKPKTT